MSEAHELVAGLDLYDPTFIADPYPRLGQLREVTPVFRNELTGQWMLTRFDDVHETLRDRRLGRTYHHRYTDSELPGPGPDPRWASFNQHERWSLLSLEPPDTQPHTAAGLEGVHTPVGDGAAPCHHRTFPRVTG